MFSPAGIIILAMTLHDSDDPQEAFIQYASFVTSGSMVQKLGGGLVKYARLNLLKARNKSKIAKALGKLSTGGAVGKALSLAAVIGVLMYPPVAEKISSMANWTDDQIASVVPMKADTLPPSAI